MNKIFPDINYNKYRELIKNYRCDFKYFSNDLIKDELNSLREFLGDEVVRELDLLVEKAFKPLLKHSIAKSRSFLGWQIIYNRMLNEEKEAFHHIRSNFLSIVFNKTSAK